jgi:hypothetical protein
LNFLKVQWTSVCLNPFQPFVSFETEHFDSNPNWRDDNKNHRASKAFLQIEVSFFATGNKLNSLNEK